MAYEDIKSAASDMLDFIVDAVEPLQNRINDLNAINDYLKYDESISRNYGPVINERFGMVNVHTKTVDTITLHLQDVLDDFYDEFPAPSVGALVYYWDTEVAFSLTEISSLVAELEKYMEYFQEYDGEDGFDISKKPTVH